MPLKVPKEWKFKGSGIELPLDAHREFFELVKTTCKGTKSQKSILEEFKTAFGDHGVSTDSSWAETDLNKAMRGEMKDAAMYVVAFYDGIERVEGMDEEAPDAEDVNAILAKWEVPLVIDYPHLRLKRGDIEFVEEDAPEEVKATAFVKGKLIGRGGFGAVYEVKRHTAIGEYLYAMKILEPHVFNPKPERAADRFEREMEALEKLQHRGIVTLLEAGLDEDKIPYILMPYIDGDDIRDSLSGAAPARVGVIFDEVLNALHFAHGHGVIHRDLSPDNILVRKADDQPIILDFGCAFLLDEADKKLTTTLIGKSAYIPPEVHLNPGHKDVRQDVYACGVLLYEVIAQRLPQPDDYKPLETKQGLWRGIDKVIQDAMAPVKKRIQTIAEFRHRLDLLDLDL